VRSAIPTLLAISVLIVSTDAKGRSDHAGPTIATNSVLRVLPDDGLTRQHLGRAIAGSSTARELIARIEQLQDCVLILRAHPLLTVQEHLLGRGQFWVVHGHLYGLLEYQAEPLGGYRALRIINHELAHALEVGLAPRGIDTASLRPLVLARESEETRGPVPGVETEFARAVGYRVQLELLGRLQGPSALSTVADETHLALGPLSRSQLPSWLAASGGR
jgi:hypothetical protein